MMGIIFSCKKNSQYVIDFIPSLVSNPTTSGYLSEFVSSLFFHALLLLRWSLITPPEPHPLASRFPCTPTVTFVLISKPLSPPLARHHPLFSLPWVKEVAVKRSQCSPVWMINLCSCIQVHQVAPRCFRLKQVLMHHLCSIVTPSFLIFLLFQQWWWSESRN